MCLQHGKKVKFGRQDDLTIICVGEEIETTAGWILILDFTCVNTEFLQSCDFRKFLPAKGGLVDTDILSLSHGFFQHLILPK